MANMQFFLVAAAIVIGVIAIFYVSYVGVFVYLYIASRNGEAKPLARTMRRAFPGIARRVDKDRASLPLGVLAASDERIAKGMRRITSRLVRGLAVLAGAALLALVVWLIAK